MYFSYQPDKYGENIMTDFDRIMAMMIEKANDAFKVQARDRKISHIIDLMRYTDKVEDAMEVYEKINSKILND